MPTQEERLGMVIKQEENIREIKASLAALNEHLSTFEQSVNSRFDEHTTLLTQILARLPEQP